ncbi:acyltransferase [Micromonospora sp. NPDC005305]|uniref:acyltransferase n=1 Tax=Micromonospora sp. NPDC005305 TaxID=3156875 RepID=UPI00339E34F6
MSAPHRPLPPWLRGLRSIERERRDLVHRLVLRGKYRHGRQFSIGGAAVLKPPTALHFGDRVSIGRGFHVETDASIGDDVLISSYVSFISNDHQFDDPEETVFTQGRTAAAPPIVIEGDTLIGFQTVVLGGVRIGRGAIVGAGSLVTGDLPPYTICYGRPARPQRDRFV